MADSFLIVHGYEGSGPGHWQPWLADRLRANGFEVSAPDLPDPYRPSLDAWSKALSDEVARHDPALLRVLCHSLGSVTWLHLAQTAASRLAKDVLLVAPPSDSSGVEEIAEFVPAPCDPDSVARASGSTRIVCAATDDPYCPEGPSIWEPLRVPIELVPGGGHLNTDAGFGPWPAVERWCLEGRWGDGQPS